MEKIKKSFFSKGSSSQPAKQTSKKDAVIKAPIKYYRATPGHILPISYKGSIIHIGTTEAVEIDIEALEYEPRIQFEKALREKQIEVEGVLQ